MRYAEGARLFYRALASDLVIEVGVPTSIQLVVPPCSSPPVEDQLALARSLATRNQDSLVEPQILDANNVDPMALPTTPLVVDCRRLASAAITARFRLPLYNRADVVLLVSAEVAHLGCRVVSFDWNNRPVFEAITTAFIDLVRQLGYRGQALEMPARFLKRGLRGVHADFRLFEESNHRPNLSNPEIERFCDSICRTWVYRGSPISGAAVRDWVRQFENRGVLPEALSLLEHLNRDGYIPKGEIVSRLLDLYSALKAEDGVPEPRPVSIQRIAKSEPMLFYELREIDPNPPFLLTEIAASDSADHLVCFDDVVGSGMTLLDCFFAGQGTVDADDLTHWLTGAGRRITILVALASKEGINAIEGDHRCQGKIKVRAARMLTQDDSVFGAKSRVFENPERRNTFQRICKGIGERLFPNGPLGWGDCQWCVATDYNTPDCSLPILWAHGTVDFPWIPIFPRR